MAMSPETPRPGGSPTLHPLACGRTVEQVFEELEAGRPDPHTDVCPHCSTARASLRALAAATEELVQDPAEPPPGLLDTIMAAVRADLARGGSVPLPAPMPELGPLEISTHALASVLRYAADTVEGVRAHRCDVEVVAAGAVHVTLSVSVHFGTRIDVLDRVRERVAAMLPERIGLRLAGLDLELADVWSDGGAP